MIRPLELYIGLRYIRAKRRNHFISFISLMATLGIVLGVAALITVLSVMNGFGNELRARILAVVSHVTITEGWSGMRDWQSVNKKVMSNTDVAETAPYINGEGILMRGGQASGVQIRGILPDQEKKVSLLASNMISGDFQSLKSSSHSVLLGKTLARKLDLEKGDRVALVTQTKGQKHLSPTMLRLTVTGIFNLGLSEFDGSLILIHQQDAKKLFRTGGEVTGLRLRLHDGELAPSVSMQLEKMLGPAFRARDWTQSHKNFFIALQDQKRVLFIILTLILAIAAFNIVSTLIMMVIDKQEDISILRTLGLNTGSITAIFMIQGTLIAVVGTMLGTICGVILAWNVESIVGIVEQWTGISFLASDVYPMTDLPTDINWRDLTLIISSTLILGFLATIYPAWRAARVQPAEALRYE